MRTHGTVWINPAGGSGPPEPGMINGTSLGSPEGSSRLEEECPECGDAGDPGCCILQAEDGLGHRMFPSAEQASQRQERPVDSYENRSQHPLSGQARAEADQEARGRSDAGGEPTTCRKG